MSDSKSQTPGLTPRISNLGSQISDCRFRSPTGPNRYAILFPLAAVVGFLPAAAIADVQLPSVLSSNCVIQRDMPAPIWGRAVPGEKVTVTLGEQTKTAEADRFGRWRVELDAMPGRAVPQTLTVAGATSSVEVDNVYVGDVFLSLTPTWYVGEEPKLVEGDADPAKLPVIANNRPAGVWEHNSHAVRPQEGFGEDKAGWGVYAKGQKYFPAEAFYLGLNLTPKTQTPLGVVGIGLSSLESMTPPQGFAAFEKPLGELAKEVLTWEPHTPRGRKAYQCALDAIGAWLERTEPKLKDEKTTFRDFSQPPRVPGPPANERAATTMYNRVIHRYTPGRVRGVILRPGEYNLGDPQWATKAKALILGLRLAFGQKDLPVCLLQLPSGMLHQRGTDPNEWTALRHTQAGLASFPGVTVIPMYDLHYRDAMEPYVGRRVGRWAAAVVEGRRPAAPAAYKSHRIEDGCAIVVFAHTGGGLLAGKPLMEGRNSTGLRVESTGSPDVGGFELAGADGVWHAAEARIDKDTVIVMSKKVENPVAVRYAWQIQPKTANLYGRDGTPAMPFIAERKSK